MHLFSLPGGLYRRGRPLPNILKVTEFWAFLQPRITFFHCRQYYLYKKLIKFKYESKILMKSFQNYDINNFNGFGRVLWF